MSLRIVIVGGVAGGMSAATRARRLNESASITVLERSGFISFANCGLPYYLSGRINAEEKLLLTDPQRARERYNIDARVGHEVVEIDRQAKAVSAVQLATGERIAFPYDKLILAPGASAITPPLPGVDAANVFQLRSMEDTRGLRRWLDERKPARAVIVGAGFIGLEVAETLRERGLEVTLVEKAPHVLPPLDSELAPYIHEEIGRHGVKIIAGTGLAGLRTEDGRATGVVLEDGRTIDADVVLLSIGVRPNTQLAVRAGLKLGATGAIAVDEHLRTSDPDIYAVGDAAEVIHGVTGKPVRMPLAGPANRHGRLAGEHAATGSSAPAPRVYGTAAVGVFGLTVAMTGLCEPAARAAGFDVETTFIHPAHHAGYYPGAQQMHLKLIFERGTGRILGAQAVGGAGVDKRIDVVATAMHFGGTIHDLGELDLAYAPQYGSAKDPIHMAAFVAGNQLRGVMPAAGMDAIPGALLVDVRTPREFAAGTLPGAVNIPVDELRQRLGELPKEQAAVIFCQVGLRGYVAQRILQQHGYNVRNLKGGYLLASKQGA